MAQITIDSKRYTFSGKTRSEVLEKLQQAKKCIIGYHALYNQLLYFYRKNNWADYYILPDYPPTSLDSPEEIQQKVRLTVEGGRQFYWELPSHLRDKTIGVIHGRNLDEIHYCLVNYKRLGIPLHVRTMYHSGGSRKAKGLSAKMLFYS